MFETTKWKNKILFDGSAEKTTITAIIGCEKKTGQFQIVLNEKFQTLFTSTYYLSVDDNGYVYNLGVDPSIILTREDLKGFNSIEELKKDFIARAERRFPGQSEKIWEEIRTFAEENSIRFEDAPQEGGAEDI